LFLLPALSLAGIPPFSGFWAKLTLVTAGLQAEQYWIVAAALLVGLLTLLSMGIVFAEAFWKNPPPKSYKFTPGATGGWFALTLPIAGLVLLSVGIGLWADPLLRLSQTAAQELLDPSQYIRVVLGVSR
jgi:multicomponent Na+:H+ antiporter subunit D